MKKEYPRLVGINTFANLRVVEVAADEDDAEPTSATRLVIEIPDGVDALGFGRWVQPNQAQWRMVAERLAAMFADATDQLKGKAK